MRTAGHGFDASNLPLLLTLALGVFAGALDLGVLSPALPALAAGFHAGPREVAWVFTLYLFANIVSIPVMTKLSDSYGRRPVYIACVTIFAAGSVFAILAPTIASFLAARAIQAVGAGGIFPVAVAAVADRVPLERRGSALGLLGAVWGLAAIIGPTAGGIVTHLASWRWIFAANVPLALVVIGFARVQLPTTVARARGPLDVWGILTMALGLLCTMAAFTIRTAAVPAGAVAILSFAALAAIEMRAREPIIAPALFRSRQLALTYGLEIAIGVLEGALFFVPAALVAAEGLSAAAAGAIAAAGAVVFVAVIPLAGRALDAFGSRAVLAGGAACTAAGLFAFSAALPHASAALASILLAGVGFGALLGAPTRYIVTNAAPSGMRGSAAGLLSIFLIVGQILGGSLAGCIVGNDMRDPTGFRAAYQAFATIGVLATLATAFLASRSVERAAAL